MTAVDDGQIMGSAELLKDKPKPQQRRGFALTKQHGRRTAAAVTALRLAMPHQAAAVDDPAEADCHQKDTTVAIMDCLGGLAGQWDNRLNAAYQAALKASESGARKDALIRTERAWLAYRKANCSWYDTREGTIRK